MPYSGKSETGRYLKKGMGKGVKLCSYERGQNERDFLWQMHRRMPKYGKVCIMGSSVYSDIPDGEGRANIVKAFESGASMITVGSIAVTQPGLFIQWMEKYGPEKMILGADVRNGMISINGWKKDSQISLLPFLKQYVEAGVKNVLCTEISKDGTLQGPAVTLYKEIMSAYPKLHLIASGGVSRKEDIDELESEGIPAVVFGKAIYEGRINLKELLNE